MDLAPTEPVPNHWIVFMARPVSVAELSPGHSFVLFGWEDDQAQQTRFEAWGFNPEGHDKTGFTSAPGQMDDEWRSGAVAKKTTMLRVRVSKKQFDKAFAVARAWQDKPPAYHVTNQNNCNSFALQVAQAIGLKSGSSPNSTTPVNFVDSLTK